MTRPFANGTCNLINAQRTKVPQTSKIGYTGVNEEPWPFPGALSEAQRTCRHLQLPNTSTLARWPDWCKHTQRRSNCLIDRVLEPETRVDVVSTVRRMAGHWPFPCPLRFNGEPSRHKVTRFGTCRCQNKCGRSML